MLKLDNQATTKVKMKISQEVHDAQEPCVMGCCVDWFP